MTQVDYVNAKYQTAKHKIDLFAADQGVLSQSMFQVMTPEVEKYLLDHRIESECAMPHNHNYGTNRIERTLRTIQELIRFAMIYILFNPNFETFGFTKTQVLKLWGELFHWAILLINLKQSPCDPKKTKYEVFLGIPPDLRNFPLLPIFASLYVLRVSGNADLNSVHQFWQKGLYVGPSRKTVGAVRVAVVTNGKVHIITSNNIKAVSDGGDNNPYATAERAIPTAIADLQAVPSSTSTVQDAQRTVPSVRGSAAPSVPVSAFTPPRAPEPSRVVPVPSVPAVPSVQFIPMPSVSKPLYVIPFHDVALTEPSASVSSTVSPSVSDPRTTAVVSPVTLPASPVPTVLPAIVLGPVSASSKTFDLPVPKPTRISRVECPPVRKALPTKKVYNPSAPERSRAARHLQRERDHASAKTVESFLAACSTALLKTADTPLLEESCFVDWSTHTTESCYLSFGTGQFIMISNESIPVEPTDVCYRAVKGPATFAAAMTDPDWQEAATKEFGQVISENNTVVSFDVNEARRLVANGDAQVLWLMPVYEEKIKEGVQVRKVRLVADGRQHTKHGPTYAPTPSRSELFTLLHLFATHNLDYYHVDEIRAFLSAKRQDEHVVFARLRGDPHYWKIICLMEFAINGVNNCPRHVTMYSISFCSAVVIFIFFSNCSVYDVFFPYYCPHAVHCSSIVTLSTCPDTFSVCVSRVYVLIVSSTGVTSTTKVYTICFTDCARVL